MKVITLHKTDFEAQCQNLFSKIELQPDVVIGILDGGGFVLEEYQKIASATTEIATVKLQRTSTQSFKKESFFKKLIKVLPYFILNILRKIEHYKNTRKTTYQLQTNLDIKINAKPEAVKSILILDDALDTGLTVHSVVQSLRKKYPNPEIRTAVVSWTNIESIVAPDYYVYKNVLIRYPWSLDYKTKSHE